MSGRERSISTPQEFWPRVDRTQGPEACWLWTRGRRWIKGLPTYGVVLWEGHHVHAHRIALLLTVGPPSEDRPWGLHRCDNPPCCNPAHLKWGTPQENSDQMWSRGRGRPHPTHGTFNGNARLTSYQVREIRALYPSLPQVVLAEMFGVKQPIISAIVRRKAWSRLP